MSKKASVVITLPESMGNEAREDVVTVVRQTAICYPSADFRTLLIVWEDTNLWSLRGLVERTVSEVETLGYAVYFPSRSEAMEGGSNTNLALFGYW